MIKNLDHNLDYTVDYCRYTCPLHFAHVHDDDLNRMDDIAALDENFPNMNHFVAVDTHMVSVNSAVLTFFDHNNNQHLLDTFAVYANYQIVHLDRYSSLQIAKVNEKNNEIIFVFFCKHDFVNGFSRKVRTQKSYSLLA